jgi:lipid II:glycine glycyltransferase (peptidoglycan interpeptide bridge formation enzyme)
MANVVYLKGVRTRYKNILYTSLDEAKILFDSNILEIDLEEQIANVVKCIEKINTYINKVEMQSEKLASVLNPEKDKETDKLVKDGCELCYAAMEIFLNLKACKGN